VTANNPEPQPAPDETVVEHRSVTGAVVQGVAATGALAYGLGHLAEGTAKLKDAFGGGQGEQQPQPPPPEQSPGKPTE
jgi:hypothetical protein